MGAMVQWSSECLLDKVLLDLKFNKELADKGTEWAGVA